MIFNALKLTYATSVELLIIGGFVYGFSTEDFAKVLACIISIVTGFGLRMVMLKSSGVVLSKETVSLHGFATLCIAWTAWQFWKGGGETMFIIKNFNLQFYLIACSFMSLYLVQSLDRFLKQVGNISFKGALSWMHKTFISDDKTKEVIEKKEEDTL